MVNRDPPIDLAHPNNTELLHENSSDCRVCSCPVHVWHRQRCSYSELGQRRQPSGNLIDRRCLPGEPGDAEPEHHRQFWLGAPRDQLGRRAFSAPNNLPANFFNVNSPRGVVFSTPGSDFQVSARVGNGTATAIEFGNLNASYPALFATFSAQRLFTALGGTATDINFFIPGSTIPATVSGFGAVFTDVDLPNVSSLQVFDQSNALSGTFFVPATVGRNEALSFVGVLFTTERISRVRITAGNQSLSGLEVGDVVGMDDFI